MTRSFLSTLAVGLLCAQPALADFYGEVGVEYQHFQDDPSFEGQGENAASIMVEPTWSFTSENDNNLYDVRLFFRLDENDDERTKADIRELSWIHTRGDWELRSGIRKVFWGVAETQHLVDIINQTDSVDRVDGEVKLGQPMVNFSRRTDFGDFDVYVLPVFRERTFAGESGRFRPSNLVDSDNSVYESSDGDSNVDYAARWAHSLGVWDIGFSYFDGTGREPVMRPSDDEKSLIPHYVQIKQLGLDAQATLDSWLLKLEVIDRSASSEYEEQDITAAVAGFEKSFYGIAGTAADLGLIYEYYDGHLSDGSVDDFVDPSHFVGLRLALNDEQSTDVLLGCDAAGTICQLEGSRRIGDSWKASIRASSLSGLDDSKSLSFLKNDSHLQFNLSYFF